MFFPEVLRFSLNLFPLVVFFILDSVTTHEPGWSGSFPCHLPKATVRDSAELTPLIQKAPSGYLFGFVVVFAFKVLQCCSAAEEVPLILTVTELCMSGGTAVPRLCRG